MILIQRKFLFLTLLYSGLLACHLQTSANAMHRPDETGRGSTTRSLQMDRRGIAPKKSSSNHSFLSCCCGDEEEKEGFKPLTDDDTRDFSPQKPKKKNIETAPAPHMQSSVKTAVTHIEDIAAPHTQSSFAIPLFPRKVNFEVEEDLNDGETDPQNLSSSQVNEEIPAFSVTLSIKESAGFQIPEDPIIRNHITNLLNSQTPSRLAVSLINNAENCLGNAQFCTYAFGHEPALPSPKPSRSSKSSVAGNQEIRPKPLLNDEPFSEKKIAKVSRSIQGMQIEDIAWTYAEHFFNELQKKKDGNVFFSYYGYKLPEAYAFARLITPTIVYDLTLPRKEGTGSVATSNTKSSVSSNQNGHVTQSNTKD